MKRVILLSIIAIAISSAVVAQQEAPQKDRFAGLDLTAVQKKSIDSLKQEYSKKIKTIKNDAALSQEEKVQKTKELRKTQMQASLTFLTAEQKKQLKQQAKAKPKKEGE